MAKVPVGGKMAQSTKVCGAIASKMVKAYCLTLTVRAIQVFLKMIIQMVKVRNYSKMDHCTLATSEMAFSMDRESMSKSIWA